MAARVLAKVLRNDLFCGVGKALGILLRVKHCTALLICVLVNGLTCGAITGNVQGSFNVQ
jgi:hypothetical protein